MRYSSRNSTADDHAMRTQDRRKPQVTSPVMSFGTPQYKYKNLRILRLCAAGQQSQPGHDLAEDQIQQSYRHDRRSCTIGLCSAISQVSAVDGQFGTHRPHQVDSAVRTALVTVVPLGSVSFARYWTGVPAARLSGLRSSNTV
jgi:hypothetical protein